MFTCTDESAYGSPSEEPLRTNWRNCSKQSKLHLLSCTEIFEKINEANYFKYLGPLLISKLESNVFYLHSCENLSQNPLRIPFISQQVCLRPSKHRDCPSGDRTMVHPAQNLVSESSSLCGMV